MGTIIGMITKPVEPKTIETKSGTKNTQKKPKE